jgi:putative intracellular protease/amidase
VSTARSAVALSRLQLFLFRQRLSPSGTTSGDIRGSNQLHVVLLGECGAAQLFAVLIALSMFCTTVAEEPKWESILPAIDSRADAVVGEWTNRAKTLSVGAANGARLALPVEPQGEYDLRISFTRQTGQHSIGVIVVQGGRQVAIEVDAWGMNLSGIQDLDGRTIRDNPTRRAGMRLENGRRYTLVVEVRNDGLRALLNEVEFAKHATDGSDLSLSSLWAMPDSKRLGLIAWNSATDFHAVDVRAVSGESISLIRSPQVAAQNGRPSRTPRDLNMQTPPTSPHSPSVPPATGKHVLIVIANNDFFYREYAEPRAELERAGIRVTVAAGRRAASRPHHSSGEGADGGVVTPDIALKDVKASDYDAILFSGGWGSSMYQYAFTGRYNNDSYNGDRATKAEANRVINEFIQQDKYVGALCNAVSVLAWARVDGKSPLAGKRVCAPTRQAAAGIYNGRQAQPSCRWHPEQNGAIMSPAGAIGDPNSSHDDVLVDGKIITGEDDPSAREMGRRIAEVLLQQ